MSFLKKGKEAAAQIANEQAQSALRQKSSGAYNYRFWVPKGKKSIITFLDGDLMPDGTLNAVTMYEHMVKQAGKMANYPCLQEHGPCPICESGEKASLVAFFTVIDHTSYTDRNGETKKNQKRLFACKPTVLELLRAQATKRGGLTGVTYEVTRTLKQGAPVVGDQYDFEDKKSLDELKKTMGITDITPLNYDELVPEITEAELRQLGWGSNSIGSVPMSEGSDDYGDVL